MLIPKSQKGPEFASYQPNMRWQAVSVHVIAATAYLARGVLSGSKAPIVWELP